MENKITILTPTYNRGYVLSDLYKSLKNQINKNFEWLIIDDGSNDNTKELVDLWLSEKTIDIRYIYQENKGKPAAHNVGVKNARYDIFVCVDSDDTLSNDAVHELLKVYEDIKDNDFYVGIIAYREIKNFVIKKKFPNIYSTTLEKLNSKYKYDYDLLLCYKTKIFKNFEFPIIESEKFIQESYIYNQIDLLGEMVLLPKYLYICEYLEDGYSQNIEKFIKNNPKGYTLCAKQKLEISNNILSKIKGAVRFTVGCLLLKEKSKIFSVKGIINKLIIFISLPISIYIYLKKYIIKRGK